MEMIMGSYRNVDGYTGENVPSRAFVVFLCEKHGQKTWENNPIAYFPYFVKIYVEKTCGYFVAMGKNMLTWFKVYLGSATQQKCSELVTQDCIPNKWKECMKNVLLKSMTKAAERYFRKRLRRQQRNMPAPSAIDAIVISDNSDDDVEILS